MRLGEFGPADPAVSVLSGVEQYNMEWTVHVDGKLRSLGVLAKDGMEMTVKNPHGDVYQLNWMTEEDCIKALGNKHYTLSKLYKLSASQSQS